MTLNTILFGRPQPPSTADAGLLILRVGVGLAMAFAHGLGKIPVSEGFVGATAALGFPFPVLFAWAAALSEFLGGLLLAVGLVTRPAAFFLACTMATAFFVQHGADPFGDKELAFVYLVASLALLAAGPGRYSVDRSLQRPEPEAR